MCNSNAHPPKLTDIVHTSCAVSAVEQLQVMASKRQYKEAAAQLEVRHNTRCYTMLAIFYRLHNYVTIFVCVSYPRKVLTLFLSPGSEPVVQSF
jgi:hypothetical protein